MLGPTHIHISSQPRPDAVAFPSALHYAPVVGGGAQAGYSAYGSLPTPPRSFSEIDTLSVGEVDRILADEDALDHFFESLQAVKALRAHRNQLRDHNEQLAHDNLSREKELRELLVDVALVQDKLANKRHTLESLLRRQEEIAHSYGSGLPAKLKEAAAQAEAESEMISQDFVEGRSTAQEFVKSFLAKRQLYHLRSNKHEALLHSLPSHH